MVIVFRHVQIWKHSWAGIVATRWRSFSLALETGDCWTAAKRPVSLVEVLFAHDLSPRVTGYQEGVASSDGAGWDQRLA